MEACSQIAKIELLPKLEFVTTNFVYKIISQVVIDVKRYTLP